MRSALAQRQNSDPEVHGSGENGWKCLPNIVDATMYPEWVDNDKGAYLPIYQTAGIDTAEVTRAVIILQGKVSHISEARTVISTAVLVHQRACWSDWNTANNALYNATYNDPTIKHSQISIMCPCFLTKADLNAGAANDRQLLWEETTWISGHRNVAPDSVCGVNSFDVLDALVAYYMNRNVYPNLKVLVIGGHSAGGQMAQRYVTLRIPTDNDDMLHFWVANPASLCWLTSNRPFPDDGCKGFDDFKYGLKSNFPAYASKSARALGRDDIVKRYYSRTLN
ncbi:uncharacterized protein EV420DRAFT_1645842 [Desarmillaria tabescens]|uniref:Uncharacterized protein n=1 Tax=Armillaria tabescens TaxID=1929756 RepID=A0AA39K2J8_ARMTA|nr:uncharacterized protein EV420DRAFT_1645842 [Desarmillaria tabescens]KAK0452201.1 hypothetical protein EV420DRAFT_1645842 [Desarmillaria tabescens]